MGDTLSPWRDCGRAVPMVTGGAKLVDGANVWQWLCNPLPPNNEHLIVQQIRGFLNIKPSDFSCSHRLDDLDYLVKQWLSEFLNPEFFRLNNPVLRHTVPRKRKQLEADGLLEKVGVNTHPSLENNPLYSSRFIGLGIATNTPFDVAYAKAEEFSRLLQTRTKAGGL